MHHGVTHSLIYQIQRPIQQHLHKTKLRQYSDIFLPVALIHCTHTRLYKAVHYSKKSLLTMENLHNKSFNNVCSVAGWLIISGLNAILSCASSKDSYPNSADASSR